MTGRSFQIYTLQIMLQCQHGYWQITDDICKMQILTDKSCFLLVLLNDNRQIIWNYIWQSHICISICVLTFDRWWQNQSQHSYWELADGFKFVPDKSRCDLIWRSHICISTYVLAFDRWFQIAIDKIMFWFRDSYCQSQHCCWQMASSLCSRLTNHALISRSLFITNMYLQVLFLFQHPYWQLKMISNFPFNRQVVLISDFNWQIMIWFQYPYWSLIFNHYSYMVKICQVQ